MPFSELDWESQDPPGPATESSEESGYERDTDVDEERGQSDELEGDAGDVADEGPGHRG